MVDILSTTASTSDPETRPGGLPVMVSISQAQGHVMELLTAIGPCDDETLQAYHDVRAQQLDWPRQRCVRKRRCDLVKLGLVRDTGRKVRNAAGLPVREWGVVS
jgi:hypothetical protein